MALRSTYNSSNRALTFLNDASTENSFIEYTSQLRHVFTLGAQQSVPVIAAATSGQMPCFGHLNITGSTASAFSYYLETPSSPFGQNLTIRCDKSSTSTVQSVWASTDGSVTWDGTNQTLKFSSNSTPPTGSVMAVAVSSQRWHLISYSTVAVTLSTSST